MPPRMPSACPEHAPCVLCGSPRVLNTQPRSHAQCMQSACPVHAERPLPRPGGWRGGYLAYVR
eukprot:scaffold2058_cov69-Phaeocystis_antarctica.AAC.6